MNNINTVFSICDDLYLVMIKLMNDLKFNNLQAEVSNLNAYSIATRFSNKSIDWK